MSVLARCRAELGESGSARESGSLATPAPPPGVRGPYPTALMHAPPPPIDALPYPPMPPPPIEAIPMAELMLLMLNPPAPWGLQLGPTPTPIDMPIGMHPTELIELYVGAMLPIVDIAALVIAPPRLPASLYSFCDWSMVIELTGAGVAGCCLLVKRES